MQSELSSHVLVGPQVSLMVHPDKCSHERAKEAFEVLNNANKDLLSEERRREVVHVLKMARGKCPPILSVASLYCKRCARMVGCRGFELLCILVEALVKQMLIPTS